VAPVQTSFPVEKKRNGIFGILGLGLGDLEKRKRE